MWIHHISGSNFIKGMTKNNIQMATDLNYHKYMTIKNVNLNFNQSGYMWIIHRLISSWGMMKIHCAINVIDWFKFLQLFHSLSKHTITTSFIIRIPITTKIIYLLCIYLLKHDPGFLHRCAQSFLQLGNCTVPLQYQVCLYTNCTNQILYNYCLSIRGIQINSPEPVNVPQWAGTEPESNPCCPYRYYSDPVLWCLQEYNVAVSCNTFTLTSFTRPVCKCYKMAKLQYKKTHMEVIKNDWMLVYSMKSRHINSQGQTPWASCQIRKIASCACAWNAENVFPATAG